jgi:hypothetical protein
MIALRLRAGSLLRGHPSEAVKERQRVSAPSLSTRTAVVVEPRLAETEPGNHLPLG